MGAEGIVADNRMIAATDQILIQKDVVDVVAADAAVGSHSR